MSPAVATDLLNLLYGITTLALVAAGLAVVFGWLGVLNMAHGEFLMLGAYSAAVVQHLGWPFPLAIPVALGVCGVLGYVAERSLIRHLYARPFDTLLATWGLSLLLRKAVEAIFGNSYQNVSQPLAGSIAMGGVDYPAYRLLLMAVTVAGLTTLFVWYLRSNAALRIRAMLGNPDLARAVGIRTASLARWTFVAGVCSAGVAGVLLAPLTRVEPAMGVDYLLRSFFVLIVGGLGNLLGLAAGSTLIGGTQSGVAALFNQTAGYFTVLVISILFLWLKPNGLVTRR